MQRFKGTGRAEDSETAVLTRKEFGKLLRKQAYEREKARRAKDPKFLAMKEAAKEQRRALYQKEKERRKAAQLELKARARAKREEDRAAADRELMKMLTFAAKGSNAQN